MRKVLKSGTVPMGICGHPTNMTDSFGERLSVGDIVDVWYAEPTPEGRALRAEGPEFIVMNEAGKPFIMGLIGSRLLETRYYLDGEEADETHYDFAETYYRSSAGFLWVIKKIKGYEHVVHGECWGSGNVTAYLEDEPGALAGTDSQGVFG